MLLFFYYSFSFKSSVELSHIDVVHWERDTNKWKWQVRHLYSLSAVAAIWPIQRAMSMWYGGPSRKMRFASGHHFDEIFFFCVHGWFAWRVINFIQTVGTSWVLRVAWNSKKKFVFPIFFCDFSRVCVRKWLATTMCLHFVRNAAVAKTECWQSNIGARNKFIQIKTSRVHSPR